MSEFFLLLPEIFIALTLGFVVFGEITYHGERHRLIGPTALVGLSAALIQTLITYQHGPAQVFHGALTVDGLSLFYKIIFISVAALSILTSAQTREIPQPKRTEYYALILAACLAMCLAASSADMLLAVLSLQFLNILGFFIAGFGKRSVLSVEAAVKYMVFSSVALAMFLYGLAMLFAHTHSLNIYEMHRALVASPLPDQVMLIVFVLVFLFFAFQIAAFPMYLWAPDVLQGAPTPASAFLSIGSRAAGLAVAIRFLITVFAKPGIAQGQWEVLGNLDWTKIVAVLAGATLLVGALLAFRQGAAKRLVACLVIAETGYLLLGVLVLDQVGLAAILYNGVIELFAITGIYFVLSYIYDEIGSDEIKDLAGVMGRAVPESVALILFLLTLIGVPPFPGFIGKFTLIGAAVRHQWLGLAAIAIFSMALSLVAVARLSYGLAGNLQVGLSSPLPSARGRKWFLGALLVPLAIVAIFAELVLDWAGSSLGFIFW